MTDRLARYTEVMQRCAVPGSPILDEFVQQQQHQRSTISNAGELASVDVTNSTEVFRAITGGMSAAGVAVTEKTAMQVAAVYACVNLIGGAISSMPLPIYQRTAEGRVKVAHPLSPLLNRQPHARFSAAVFFEFVVASLLLHGDAYAEIQRPSLRSPLVLGLRPWPKAALVDTKIEDGMLAYFLYDDERKAVRKVLQDDMLHIPGAGFDGKNGMSQIRHGLRASAGIALAADQYSAEFFSNGSRPDFALEFPGVLTPEQQAMIRENWYSRYQGSGNRHLPALLTGGAKVHEVTMTAEDSQLLGTRQMQVEEIARLFGVPPHMIGHTTTSTSWGTGIEQQSIGFVKFTLSRHIRKIEQEINRKLLRGDEYYCEFSTAGLERGDYKTRNEGYRIGLGRAGEPAWMTVNEVRKLENLPPVDGGDQLFTGGTNESDV